MGFDANKFESTQFKQRTTIIPVPEMKQFFGEDEPLWEVRCLSAIELAIANDAVTVNNNVSGVINAISSQLKSDKVEAIKEIIGISSDTVPEDIVRRYSMLSSGSVNPTCPYSVAVKLGNTFPTTLFKLTNEIIRLTGLGQLGE